MKSLVNFKIEFGPTMLLPPPLTLGFVLRKTLQKEVDLLYPGQARVLVDVVVRCWLQGWQMGLWSVPLNSTALLCLVDVELVLTHPPRDGSSILGQAVVTAATVCSWLRAFHCC